MFKYRAISFTGFILLFFAVFYFKNDYFFVDWIINAAIVFVAVAGSVEAAALLQKTGMAISKVLAAVYSLLILIFLLVIDRRIPGIMVSAQEGYFFVGFPALTALLVLATVTGGVFWLTTLCRRQKEYLAILQSLVPALAVSVPVGFLILINSSLCLLNNHGLLFVLCTTKMMDTGGYIFGMLSSKIMKNGNHKIAPTVSPKKSWEGFFGGLFMSMAAGSLFYRCSGESMKTLLVLSLLMAIGSFFGDLSESALKRQAQVKDSASWIPGMGGILDTIDSFLYNPIIMAIIALVSVYAA